ncbi:Yqey-like protein-domain-containing protein [Pterulicium gracile]|uniref:Altered inheritance of mitochondria protein 41 n=1 Tax=Pterulicium gracile TaxID=1884261 RepID=A0A5C3QTW2_9AGAR|nr:Yqey-like protein-domain-containing protein [Pterula gracilis]
MPLRYVCSSLARPAARNSYCLTYRRFFATSNGSTEDLRQTLLTALKTSMKQKNTIASVTLRSVLSDVYSADKNSNDTLVDGKSIQQILRKAVDRRADAARRFTAASRADLAAKEEAEVSILEEFLPAMLPEDELERVLQSIIQNLETPPNSDPRKHLGQVLKTLHAQVDKMRLDHELVKQKAASMLLAKVNS